MPASVEFTSDDREQVFTFTATADSIDDDGRSVRLSFGTLPAGVNPGTPSETVVSITDDDVPTVTVSFEQGMYTVAESDDTSTTDTEEHKATIRVVLSADPERTVTVPITRTNQGGATSADYSGVPAGVVFDSGDTSKTFTFAATPDSVDDDGESVKLSFGTLPTGVGRGLRPPRRSPINDGNLPADVDVEFEQGTYTVAEGSSVTVKVTLTEDPERTVTVPIINASQGGASGSDYSGVPANVVFNSSDTEKSFSFSATTDNLEDTGESVKLSFETLPPGVSEGPVNEATVNISNVQAQETLTVAFGAANYGVSEGSTTTVNVTLSGAPGSEAVIPLTRADEGGASTDDYTEFRHRSPSAVTKPRRASRSWQRATPLMTMARA